MATVTIPRELSREKNLIAVPGRVYEEFLAWQRAVKSRRTFKPTTTEKRAFARARKNFANRKGITLAQLEHELGTTR